MSEKDFDWNDDLDFESLADEKDMEADYGEPGDNFADFEDLADYGDNPVAEIPAASDMKSAEQEVAEFEPEAAVPVTEASSPQATGPILQGRPQKVISPAGLSWLVTSCTLVGAVGMAGALFLASGLSPQALWNPEGLLNGNQIFNFQQNPMNLLYVVTLGVILLTLGAVAVVSSKAKKANARFQETSELLGRVTELRLDDEIPWTSNYFKSDPDTSTFVSDILGAWRLQQARQVRSVGLEGELRRLEKALRDDSRNDLADRYDHPLVGSLADAMMGWYDDRDQARKETQAVREKDSLDSSEVLSLIEDARAWNQANCGKVDLQGTTLQRWAGRFEDLAQEFEKATGHNEAVAGLQGLQGDLARAAEKDGSGGGASSLDGLVDRGSKLAFQIAMEVAPLCARGERLLPMSQSLEELTTQFRQTVAQSRNQDDSEATSPRTVLTRLEQITVQLVKQGPGGAGNMVRTLQDLAPASRQVAENLQDISGSFGQQSNRLTNLGTNFASLTGLEFDPGQVQESEPVNPPEGGLNITQSDPFGKDQGSEQGSSSLEVDPFSSGPSDPFASSVTHSADPEISSEVTPGAEDTFATDVVEPSNGFTSGLTEEAHEISPEVEKLVQSVPEISQEPELPSTEERVYDLAEFGAVRIDQDQASAQTAEEEDRIYELAEFGAVALN